MTRASDVEEFFDVLACVACPPCSRGAAVSSGTFETGEVLTDWLLLLNHDEEIVAGKDGSSNYDKPEVVEDVHVE